MRRLILAGSVFWLSAGCKKTPEPTLVPTGARDPVAQVELDLGPPLAEADPRRERLPIELSAGPRAVPEGPDRAASPEPVPAPTDDPEDDPELVDDYFGDVEDGKTAEPPPRPTNLPGDRAFSIGPPNGGWLVNGKPIALRGRWHRVLPGTVQRAWHHGTDALIGLLERAAQQVGEKHGGAPLRVGNMSRQEGGKIAPSVSHQSGRDVDIGLFATDLDGETVDPGGFPKFDGSRGDVAVDTTGNYLFDVARNWTFVQALLRDPAARVQWIFLDTPLEALLLDYAVRTHQNAELISRAEKVIVRPGNSSPHANHFHVRIFCTQGDIEYGCKDMGPEWDWVETARAVDDQLLEGIVEDIMAGRTQLDLMNPETGTPPQLGDPDALRTPPIALPKADGTKATSPDQLPDPPLTVDLRMNP